MSTERATFSWLKNPVAIAQALRPVWLHEVRGPALKNDVLAGLTTAIMLVPQAMAYALLAGLDPIVGLYASTLPLVATRRSPWLT